jgi:hypothetical protein
MRLEHPGSRITVNMGTGTWKEVGTQEWPHRNGRLWSLFTWIEYTDQEHPRGAVAEAGRPS